MTKDPNIYYKILKLIIVYHVGVCHHSNPKFDKFCIFLLKHTLMNVASLSFQFEILTIKTFFFSRLLFAIINSRKHLILISNCKHRSTTVRIHNLASKIYVSVNSSRLISLGKLFAINGNWLGEPLLNSNLNKTILKTQTKALTCSQLILQFRPRWKATQTVQSW